MKNLPFYALVFLIAICIACTEGSTPMGTGGDNDENIDEWDDQYGNDTTNVNCVCRLVTVTINTDTELSTTVYGDDEIRDCDDEIYYVPETIISGNTTETTSLQCD